MTNEQIIWNFLKEKIGNEYGVAGLMGNLYAESGLIPTNMENTYESKLGYTDATYTTAVDNGTYTKFSSDAIGYGLAQWTYSTRKKALLAYAKQKGVSIGDLNMQLEYLYKELNENYSGVLQALKSATSIQSASNKVLTDFERPANQSNNVKTIRAKYGQSYYDRNANKEEITTMEYTVENLLKIAQNEIGYYEKASNSNLDSKTANAGANNWTKYARDLAAAGYYNGNKNGYAWCDVFVDWCFYQLAGKDATKAQYLICQTGDLGAAVNYSAGYYKNAGRYYTSGPKAGDQIFFNSNGSMTHTGIVESVTSTYVNTIEGNTSNMVARRSYRIGASNISGYGRPRYDGDGNLSTATGATSNVVTGGVPSDGTPSTSTSTTTTNTIKIKAFQTWINKTISAGLTVDGIFGSQSKKAAIKVLQNYLNTQYNAGLKVDGDYGKLSQAAIVKAKINITKDSDEKTLVYLIQGMLYVYGYAPAGFDGEFGAGTFTALKKFQSNNGLTSDGEAGPKTFNKMFG